MPQFTVKNKGIGTLSVKPLFSQNATANTPKPSVTQVYRDATRNKLNMAPGTGVPAKNTSVGGSTYQSTVNNTGSATSGNGGSGSGLSSQLQSLYQQQVNTQNSIANDLANQLKAQ